MDYEVNNEIVNPDVSTPPTKVKRTYPQELKDAIVKRANAGESIMSLAKEYGMSNVNIYTWLGRVGKNKKKTPKVKKRKYRNITRGMGKTILKNPPPDKPTSVIQSLSDAVKLARTKISEAMYILENI